MLAPPSDALVWLGIVVCVSQSAMFSGLNLALLGISRMRLEVEASTGNPAAISILAMRRDFNFLLTTILWGNVAVNVLLTLLSNSVMAGVGAFFFSVFVITFVGEIAPQAYFSRHAMRMGSLLAPVLRCYQMALYPVAKPSALVLDWWLGTENIRYFRERDLREMIHKHIEAEETDVGYIEGMGALNFLALDDVAIEQEGEEVDPDSIMMLPKLNGIPAFPAFERTAEDPFLCRINRSGKSWVIIVDESNAPYMVLNASDFLRDAVFGNEPITPVLHCHEPIIIEDANVLIGSVLSRLHVDAASESDDVIDNDLILLWSESKRVITGGDLLGRLLRGISQRDEVRT